MTDPAIALLVATLVVAAGAVLLWPVKGFLWRALVLLRSTERVRIEDALKHLYDCEYRRSPCTLLSLAGALGLSGNRSAALLARLEELGLVQGGGGAFELTARGRSDALQVIRIHRLWERYLSEETGFHPTEWHAQADEREHRLGHEEAEALAQRMGEPRFDPHGDPIPTAAGDIAPARGRHLSELAAGEVAEIVHVEDEPEAVYAQLVAEGLHPGQLVRVTEVSPRFIRFETGADEHLLAPVLADNVTVLPLAAAAAPTRRRESLAALRVGERATVLRLGASCRGAERRRLLDLGIVPGTVIEAELESPGGDPVAYRVRGAMIALRAEQAGHIQVERLNAEAQQGAPS